MTSPREIIKKGKLLELSPFDTGFIEDTSTGARYGFHVSMLKSAILAHDAPGLQEQLVTFEMTSQGEIANVTIN